MKTFTFELPEPPSANRWWRSRVVVDKKGDRPPRSLTYLSTEAKKYKENVAKVGKLYLMRGHIRVQIDWYRSMEAGDLDKRLGVALDALQGVFYADDKQITELIARRFDTQKGNPRIVVTVTELGSFLDL